MAITLSAAEVRALAEDTTTVGVSLTNVQAGELLIARVHTRDSTGITGVSDSVDGAWTLAVAQEDTSISNYWVAVYYLPGSTTTAGTRTVTATYGTSAMASIGASRWGGALAASPLEDTAPGYNSTAVTSHPSGTGVTTVGAGLLYNAASVLAYGYTKTAASDDGTFTVFTEDDGLLYWFGEYLITSGVVTDNTAAFTTGTAIESIAVLAAFKEAGGAAGLSVSVAEQQRSTTF